MNDNYAKTMIKIEPEIFLFHFLQQIFIGCCDNTNINTNIFIPSYPCDLSFLQCT